MRRSTNAEQQAYFPNYAPNASTEEEASVIIDLDAIRGAMEEEVVMVRKSTGRYEVIPKSEAEELRRKWDEETPTF